MLEIDPAVIPEKRKRPGALCYLYVGVTAHPHSTRRNQHASLSQTSARVFREISIELGRPLESHELTLRPDLVTETPTGPSPGQTHRAERRQANKLKHLGYVILSRHRHSLRRSRKSASA